MNRRSIIQGALAVIIFALMGLLFIVSNLRVPRIMKLAVFENKVIQINISPPLGGEDFGLLLVCPMGAPLQNEKGSISLSQDSQPKVNYEFDVNNLYNDDNLLRDQNLRSFDLTLPKSGGLIDLDYLFLSKKTVQVCVAFKNQPPKGTSLWFCFTQKEKDSWEEKGRKMLQP
jgi:hypothetical protein